MMGSSGESCTNPTEFVSNAIDGACASLDLVKVEGASSRRDFVANLAQDQRSLSQLPLTATRHLKISSSSQSIPYTGDGVGACSGQAGGSLKCIDGAGASLDLVKVGEANLR